MEAFKEWLANPLGWVSLAAIVGWAVFGVMRALGTGATSYASKKGENLATKEDLAEAVRQLKEFEETRASVAHRDWIAREWKAVRARNLEAFEAGLQASYDHAHAALNLVFSADPRARPASDGGVAIRLRTLQKLYYPELKEPLAKLQDLADRLFAHGNMYRFHAQRPETPEDTERMEALMSKIAEYVQDLDPALEQCTDALVTVARDLFEVSKPR